ncbi:MAG TPA: fibronectin type III domain-containing protein [Kiritimatiellia bacterium]|nr:fibronectin type III domain-containing protein [Kiritimatiellia bacterium]
MKHLIRLAGCVVGFAAGVSWGQVVDHAGNYSQSQGTWVSGTHRGELGWGDWVFEKSNSPNSGHFIGSSTAGGGDIDTDGKSFGMFGHSGTYAAARRYFAKQTMTTGDQLSFQVVVNFRNGLKGFTLRNESDSGVWRFQTGNSGNFVNSQDVGLNTYHANTVFTFTFEQRERDFVWTVQRTGGLTQSASGTNAITSGTIRYFRFYVDGTDNGSAQNNLYFNNFVFTPGVRGDAPLTLGERRFPGFEPSYMLRFRDPVASSVTFRSSNDGWTTSYPLTNTGGGVWEMDIRDAGLSPGFYTFKFRLNGDYESGSNRRLYIREDGKIAKPPAVYLTWVNDPATTMIVHWHTYQPTNTAVRYRLPGSGTWLHTNAYSTVDFAFSERKVQTAELAGLLPSTVYEFQVDGYDETYSFRTMPETLDEPLTAAFTGDILYGTVANAMAVTVASFDPAFLMIGGDLSYSDSRAEQLWMEYTYFENWYTRFRAPDGRLIPLIVGIGNHEVRKAYITGYPFIEDTDAWRDREAAYFFRPYAFPGQPGYNVLDFRDYLSLVVLDTDHLNPIVGAQTAWLEARLDERRHIRHLLPIIHVPAYPSHRSSMDARNVSIRQNWLPLFEGAGVHLVFEHHDHTFKRSTPLLGGSIDEDGIVFMGDGAWGVDTRTVKETEGREDLQVAEKRHHAYLATFTDTGRVVRAVDVNGVFFDQMSQVGDGIPPAPSGLATERVTSTSAEFSWSPTIRAQSYRVERNGVTVGTVTEPRFVDASRSPDSSATYRVVAVNRSGESSLSDPLVIGTLAVPPVPGTPGAPSGFALGPHSIALSWSPAVHAESYTILRNEAIIASNVVGTTWQDSGLVANGGYGYRVRADNMSGSSANSASTLIQTESALPGFSLDGQPDSPGYLLSSPGMRIYAAVRGTELYVATWTPAGGDSDHFIFVTDRLLPAATRRAPWEKKGFIARPSGSPFLGAESTSSFIGWFNAPAGASAFRSGTAGERIEGTIDLVEAFGRMPDMLYFAAAAYGTADLESLRSQAPQGNGDENIDPDEFFAVPLEALRDNLGVGIFERLDPERGFIAESEDLSAGVGFTVRWRVVPGRSYRVWRTELVSLPVEGWTPVSPVMVAPSGADEMVFQDATSSGLPRAFYHVQVLD